MSEETPRTHTPVGYREGINLILGAVIDETFKPLGYSTGCKISDSAETGERITKTLPNNGIGIGKWKQKYVKTLSEQITAEGFVYDEVAAAEIGFPILKDLFIKAQPVTLRYQYRDNAGEQYQGDFIITSLEQDGPADDDEKWSVTFENTGIVKPFSRDDNGDTNGDTNGDDNGNDNGNDNGDPKL